ncbi:hypothetical protein ACWDSJ_28345 [Nocardia sp. NPDC003482]
MAPTPALAVLLAGPGVVFAALALSYRREGRRSTTIEERCGAALAATTYGGLAALAWVWLVATTPPPAPLARPALAVGVAVLSAEAVRLRNAARRARRDADRAVYSPPTPRGGRRGNRSAHSR